MRRWKQADFNRNRAAWQRDRFSEATGERMQARREARSLPRVMLVTDQVWMQPSFNEALVSALEDGARLVLVREKHRGGRRPSHQSTHQRHAIAIGRGFDARILIHSSIPQALSLAGGVHFSAHDLVAHSIRRAVSQGLLCGASTHSLEEAQRAQQAGAHYVILGSIFPTASHPGAAPLGLQVLAQVTRAVKIPVYAIGGINAQNARGCLEAGAHGVAVIRAAWEPGERRRLLQVVGET